MKKLLSLLLAVAPALVSHAQSCHDAPATAQLFAQPDPMQLWAATDPAFVALHLAPRPFKFISRAGGKMIEMPAPDGKAAQAFFIEAKQKSDRFLVVYQEWWGLNDYIKQEAEKYYNLLGGKVNVLAPDIYDGQVAATADEARKLVTASQPARQEAIIRAGLSYGGPRARFASIGWCFGGGLSLKSAIMAGRQGVACVMYYGMPVRGVEQLKQLGSDVLGLFAKNDRISPEIVAEFDASMKAAGKRLTYRIFEAGHGFANPSNPVYDPKAATEANKLAAAYLQDRLR